MTSRKTQELLAQEVTSPTLFAIRFPREHTKLLAWYKKAYWHTPVCEKWVIDGGPPTNLVEKGSSVIFKFTATYDSEFSMFELEGVIDQVLPVGGTGHEWMLLISGVMVKKRDHGDTLESVIVPCYYNSHKRCGFGMVTLTTAYAMGVVSVYALNQW